MVSVHGFGADAAKTFGEATCRHIGGYLRLQGAVTSQNLVLFGQGGLRRQFL